MKTLIGSLITMALVLTACASADERARVKALYDKYDAHCRAHAEEALSSPDVESLYRECMDYFVGTDVHCPHCVADAHMQRE